MNDSADSRIALSLIRDHFPGVRNHIYLETSAWGLIPLAARRALDHCVELQMNGDFEKDAAGATIESIRAKFATLIRAGSDEIAIVKNVSEAVNIVIASLFWRVGDNAIICADVDHPNCIYALYNVRDRYGVEIRSVPARNYRIPVDEVIAAINERTRLVIAPSVPFSTGLRTDVKTIGAACRDRGVLFFVDGAQSVGALDMDVDAENIDALAVASSKYLCGPHGLGFLYVRRRWADQMQPAYLARYSIDLASLHEGESGGERYQLKTAAKRFDIGSYNYAAASAVEVSLDLLLACGTRTIERHVLALSHRFADELHAMGLPLLAGQTGPHLSQVVLVGGPGGAYDSARRLDRLYQHLRSSRVKLSLRRGRLRFSFHFYNIEQEIEDTVSLIRGWARQQ
ncbi:MAG: aminotransferase class V-fold PLP-dependent enzyme [Betaproteobacteria bacterium]|nr:aminotransferase class V-fold PLP-dependent enzyme [Betaproteobacteria bacterium]